MKCGDDIVSMTDEDLIDVARIRDDLARRLEDLDTQLRELDALIGRAPVDERLHAVAHSVARESGLSVYELKYGGRSTRVVAARHKAAWQARQLRPLPSYPEIARALGMRDHTVAMYAARRHAARLAAADQR